MSPGRSKGIGEKPQVGGARSSYLTPLSTAMQAGMGDLCLTASCHMPGVGVTLQLSHPRSAKPNTWHHPQQLQLHGHCSYKAAGRICSIWILEMDPLLFDREAFPSPFQIPHPRVVSLQHLTPSSSQTGETEMQPLTKADFASRPY